MFPLHETTLFILAFLLLGACVASFTAMRGPLPIWLSITVLLLALLWPWPIAFLLGPDHYVLTAALYFGCWTFATVLAGMIWGWVARRVLGWASVLAVAALPSTVAALYALERQRVPDAPCAAHASFQIGDLALAVPRDMGARSVFARGAPEPKWEGGYGDWPGVKPEVRAFCRATNGGREAMDVSHLWLAFSTFRRALQTECQAHASTEPRAAACSALARTELTVVQLYARPDGLANPSLSQFSVEPLTRALAAGQREGVLCGTGSDSQKRRYCTIWQQLTPEVLAVSAAWLDAQTEGEDPVSDAAILLEALQRHLSPN